MMTRHIIRISLVMLLGVVTSVAVAWGCAWRVQRELHDHVMAYLRSGYGARVPDPDLASQRRNYKIPAGYAEVNVYETYWIGYAQLRVNGTDSAVPHANFDSVALAWWAASITERRASRCQQCAGWPLFCVRGMGYRDSDTPTYGILTIRIEVSNTVMLPYDPVWSGLLANTAIYGGVWWAMLFGPGMVIRRRRRHAGRCAKCGYDLRGLSPAPGSASGSGSDRVCPECGQGDDKVTR